MTTDLSIEAQQAEARLHAFLSHIAHIAKDYGVVGVFSAANRYTGSNETTPRYVVGSAAVGIMHMPMAEFAPLVASLGDQSGEVVSKAANTAFSTPEARA
jgi:hypothetical protein